MSNVALPDTQVGQVVQNRNATSIRRKGKGEIRERDLRREFSQLTPDRTVFFDTYLVKGHWSPVSEDRNDGERCMKDTDHHPVHRSVHPDGERKLVGA